MVKSDIKWTISGGLIFFHELSNYFEYVRRLVKSHTPVVDSVHDCPPGLIWQGGRYIPWGRFTLDQYIGFVKKYNSLGIGVNYTFSNICLEPGHLEDDMCNYLLDQTENPMNGVILASDILRDHVRSNYPEFAIKASICNTSSDYQSLLDIYDIVVLQPDDNRKYDLISTLDTSRLEILVNEPCVQDCPYRREHFMYFSRNVLERRIIYKHSADLNACLAEKAGDIRCAELVLSNEEVRRLYNLGIRNFKIGGRDTSSEYLIDQMNYYIKNPLLRYMKHGGVL
jgi:collagenase-like PrtC family protease